MSTKGIFLLTCWYLADAPGLRPSLVVVDAVVLSKQVGTSLNYAVPKPVGFKIVALLSLSILSGIGVSSASYMYMFLTSSFVPHLFI